MQNNKIINANRKEILVAIDELNQYLNGNVSIESITDTVRELTYNINKQW
jgi:uncharacterized protein YeeX (DUF496 family)